MDLYINTYCSIVPNLALAKGFKYESEGKDFNSFMRQLYGVSSLDYPKFFKMDNLSKLGFITSELMLKDFDLENHDKENIGVVISNGNSSSDTDQSFYDTIKNKEDYFPSPALFVYTLPNIMIGEICIKNKITGENGFFISQTFDHDFINDYVRNLFHKGTVTCCIVGWVDFTAREYNSFLYLVSAANTDDAIPFTSEKTQNLYSIVFKHE